MVFAFRSRQSIRNERHHLAILAVFHLAHADGALNARIVFGIRLRIGHINDVFGVDENPAGRAVLLPFFDVVAVLIEDLNPVVIAVTHKQASFGIEGERVRSVKFARTTAFLSPSLDELSVTRKFDNTGVGGSAVSVSDKNIAVRRDNYVRRAVKGVVTGAGHTGLAECQQNLAVLVQFENLETLPIFNRLVDEPNTSS